MSALAEVDALAEAGSGRARVVDGASRQAPEASDESTPTVTALIHFATVRAYRRRPAL